MNKTTKTNSTTITYRTKSDRKAFASLSLLFNFGGRSNISLGLKIEMFINFL